MTGRPSTYTDEAAAEVCKRIGLGQSVVEIGRDPAMPCEGTVYKWLIQHPRFVEAYTRAREQQAEHYADELIAIADRVAGERESSAAVHAARLAIDARKWVTSKL